MNKNYYELADANCDDVKKLSKDNITMHDFYRTPFLFLKSNKFNYDSLTSTLLKGIEEPNKISDLFFSERNVKRIQNKIKYEIMKRTKSKYKLVADQDEKDIYVVMRAVYLEHGTYNNNKINHQVKELNKKVIESVVPGMITAIEQYYGYLKEINNPINPIDLPINSNNSGRNTLPSFTTLWQA